MHALAAYASSSSSDDEACPPPAKKPRPVSPSPAEQPEAPPPAPDDEATTSSLPPPELDDVPTAAAAVDSGGPARIRQFAHVDGQYATHVFLPVAPGPSLTSAIGHHVAGLSGKAVHAIDAAEYHVSLSRTCVLQQPQLAGFLEALRVALRGCAAPRASTGKVRELSNDTHTRFFAALELAPRAADAAALCAMIDAVDGVCVRFGQPPFYAERLLHFSVAWSLEPMPPARRAVETAARPTSTRIRADFEAIPPHSGGSALAERP